MRKPYVAIFRLALDLAQAAPTKAIFIDNTPMFLKIANRLGMHGILHLDYESTYAELASFGLQITETI